MFRRLLVPPTNIVGRRFYKVINITKKLNARSALEYYDKYYKPYYGESWDIIREALLSEHGYVAVANNFRNDVKDTLNIIRSTGGVNIREHCERTQTAVLDVESNISKQEYKNQNDKINVELETDFTFPKKLEIYTNISKTKLLNSFNITHSFANSRYFLMDGGSILPPLVLNIKPTDWVLDACASPGIKSLLLLQTLMPFNLVVNELMDSRIPKIEELFDRFLPGWQTWKNCRLQKNDARYRVEYGFYDKILVDVPCGNDRRTIMIGSNNTYRPENEDKLMALQGHQTEILYNCIRLLKPGGSLVYSTCSLDPLQNDDVVVAAITKANKMHGISAVVRDLREVVKPFQQVIKFDTKPKFGQLVIPDLNFNFGPMYFCKIKRT